MEEIIRVSLVILPRGAVKSLRIYASTHSDVVIKKKIEWEDGGSALCCVWQPPQTHDLVPPLCALLGNTNPRAEIFPAPPVFWKSAFAWAV